MPENKILSNYYIYIYIDNIVSRFAVFINIRDKARTFYKRRHRINDDYQFLTYETFRPCHTQETDSR